MFAASCGGDDLAGGPAGDAGSTADGASAKNDAGQTPASDGAVVVTPDVTAPTVLSSTPAKAATDVSPNGEIVVVFSEGMAAIADSATFTLTKGGALVPGTVASEDDTAIFTPKDALTLDTTYTATVTIAAKDLAGNALASPYTWTFTTSKAAPLGPPPVLLGAAGKYVILAKAEISTVPTSKITGDVAISPAAASYITGFSMTKAGTYWTSPQVVGRLFAADNAAPTPGLLTTAVGSMETAYTDAAGRPTPDFLNKGAGNIGGLTLTPGLYKWTSTVTIPGDVVLAGGPNDVWIFQIAGDVMMAANKAITFSGAARARNVFWQVTGIVDLGTGAHAEGIMLSKTAIKLGTGATINGRLLAQTAVNVVSSTITAPAP